jgi:hypothetical protein
MVVVALAEKVVRGRGSGAGEGAGAEAVTRNANKWATTVLIGTLVKYDIINKREMLNNSSQTIS